MDTVISQAQATLGFQRSTVDGINSKLSNVSSRLPTDLIPSQHEHKLAEGINSISEVITYPSNVKEFLARLLEISSVGDIA
ncbi:hypothetical protein JHK82_040998 [Glycine max]|nr:hypothetical protein JHK82_040998 [Glycine max]